jgi:hypothetical protein
MKPRALLPVLGLAAAAFAQVAITPESEGKLSVTIDKKAFTSFYYGPETTKPYLHPLRAASGTVVTRGYPMEEMAGDARDHIHQTGFWFSHGDVNGIDFWANHPTQQNERKGRIQIRGAATAKGGAREGTISATFEWKDATGAVLLTETRRMSFHAHPTLRIVDFDIVLTGVQSARFGDTKEGTFGMRLTTALEERKSGTMVNAGGAAKERSVWGKRSPWVDYSGEIAGEKLGVAILDHPSNPKHPTYWHSRAYGLFAANIFGERDFHNDKTRDGGLTLEPGQSWRFRYRVIVHPGDAASANVAAEFEKFAGSSSNGRP